ncbi:hypothetical protein MN0502_01230 [Arthrobacter sp. MN05-02]|nr:hypothetical protein MN0502_01230 [Arthrobacter sp. MN05-02]
MTDAGQLHESRRNPVDVAAMTGSLAACAVMAAAAAVTGWRIDAASRRDAGADDYFWIAFGGIVVIAGGGVAAATMSGAGALLAVLTGVGACAAAAAWAWRRHAQRARAARESAHSAAWGELRRHDAIIRQWADYDVDPAKAIRYPAMHDPGHPAARPVVRALRAAGDEGNPESGGRRDGRDLQRYADAVARLERTFDAAERELGELGTRRPARHREASGRF